MHLVVEAGTLSNYGVLLESDARKVTTHAGFVEPVHAARRPLRTLSANSRPASVMS